MHRPTSNKLVTVLALLLVLGMLVSCSQPAEEEDEGPPGGGSGGLYMLTGNTHGVQGLFRLDTEDGTAPSSGRASSTRPARPTSD